MDAYRKAQRGIFHLKTAIYHLLQQAGDGGMKNVEIGRTLGIYFAREKGKHAGRIPWTLLKEMEDEGVVEQDQGSSVWKIKRPWTR